jgi:hypothetical protein
MTTETFVCGACSVEVTRETSRGQRPKWCVTHRNARARQRAILGVTSPRINTPAPCSEVPKDHPSRKPMGPSSAQIDANEVQRLRSWGHAVSSGDAETVLAYIRDRVTISPLGCWEWNNATNRDGYAVLKFRVGPKTVTRGVHRLSAEAWLGGLPEGWPVHHVCAVRKCVSPLHLQSVSPQANTAEMLHRRAYERRILDLEEALREVYPTHPLLS